MGIFGWSCPPGVSRLPWDEDEPQPLRCRKCGAFLPSKPDRSEDWEDAIDCDGQQHSYTDGYSEAEVQILGEEYRGKTRQVRYSDCDYFHPKPPHPPHREILAAGTTEYRTCRKCGAEDKASF